MAFKESNGNPTILTWTGIDDDNVAVLYRYSCPAGEYLVSNRLLGEGATCPTHGTEVSQRQEANLGNLGMGFAVEILEP